MLNGGHMQVQQPGERDVDIFDFAERDLFVDSAQRREFLFSEQKRGIGAESAPLLASEVDVAADGRGRRAEFEIGNLQL
jgi:hypothetical protein